VFWFLPDQIVIGFVPEHGKFPKTIQKKLGNVLGEDEAFKKYFGDTAIQEIQVYKDFYVDTFDDSLEEMKHFLIEKYYLLEKNTKAALLPA
jgi:hypothetical protein